MKSVLNRRGLLTKVGAILAGLGVMPLARAAKAVVKTKLVANEGLKGYDPRKHRWLMGIDVNRCIGCGLCAETCKKENHVPEGPFFRTWIERYIIRKPTPGTAEIRGEVSVDSPKGGIDGFKGCPVPAGEILHSFFVPKLCNLCEHSPCVQVCPVGAAFDAPDGAVLVDGTYCIGCGFCIQACPYGCRFLNPDTRTAEKCTLCYHRITRGLKPACVEICPTQARIFGDLMSTAPDEPIRQFIQNNRVSNLKPHLGTDPRLLYAGLDKEVR
jgi:tetrathionate reductase subunit B